MKRLLLKISFPLILLPLCFTSLRAQSANFTLGKWTEIHKALLKELSASYVDSLPVDKIERAGLDAMLAALDPYTVYIPSEENQDLQMLIHKTYEGVRAVIYKPDVQANVLINEPYKDSPAAKSGLRCGDEIMEIDSQSVVGLTSSECSERMRGEPGMKVRFKVKRVYTGEIEEITVTREKIHLPDVEYAGMLDKTTGYISQTGFTEGVGEQVRKCVVELRKKGMKTLVLDLRGNGGGLLAEAAEIVSIFVPKGSVVVTAKGKEKGANYTVRTTREPVDTQMEVIVLVDAGSASASEIVAGALQDMDRATIMGQRTFGKGLVQSIRPLPYGGQLKITTAKYYTPSGRCVQAIDYSNRNEDGSVGHIPDSLTHVFYTSRGREVRDGGGITPDVKLQKFEFSDLVYSIAMSGLMEEYVLDYVRAHESIAPAKDYHFDDWDGFIEYLKPKMKDAGKLDELNREEMCQLLESEIVVRYWFQAAAVELRLRYDTELKEALSSPLI